MKRILEHTVIKLLLACLLIIHAGCQAGEFEKSGDTTTYYYAVEVNGALCGYSEVTETHVEKDGKSLSLQYMDTQVSMKLMERDFKTSFRIKVLVEPGSWKPLSNEVWVDQANVHIHSRMEVRDTLVTFIDVNEGKEETVSLPEDIVIDNILYYSFLVEDFYTTGMERKTYAYLNEREQRVEDKEFIYDGLDTLFLAGSDHICMRFTEVGADGMVAKSWIDPLNGLQLRSDIVGGGRNIYLSDYRVKEMVSTLSMDDMLFYPVNRVIPGFKRMTYMKVDVEISSSGSLITPESLNYPGQRFKGTVEENLVSGTFELEPMKYDGTGAPSFPYDYSIPDEMKKYVEPEVLIESDDIEIMHTARTVTREAGNAWEAAVILSRWVSDNISGALPGGGSARGTYQMRQAECGGHSRLLTAMCRAVGIPARLSVGGMYVPDNNGFFGQHAWTEVFMGEAGWIPVDATIGEIDYIDAGHIRLGERSTFHPKKMEIVEYRME